MRLLQICLALVLLAGASASAWADAPAQDPAPAFFARYVELSDAYDARVAELYSDTAVIRAYRRYPHGVERAMELSGTQWKALLARAMPLAQAQGDRSVYRNVAFSAAGTRTKIKADRYSVRKCYTDTGYYMIIERQPGGDYRIVEEYSETQPQSNC